jgi:hypothetical protein
MMTPRISAATLNSAASTVLEFMPGCISGTSPRGRKPIPPGKSQYQYGGEPVQELEVLISPLLCFHDPRVLEAFKKQIDEMLKFSGVKGVAFDFIGYRNYTCCRCATSMAQLEVFRKKHPDLSQEQSLQRFSLETLVEFNNRLSAHVRASTAEARVITHVYPVFLPEPLYGNRLDVDVCAQTAAWYFKPYWSLEKIRAYSGVIARDATRYHPRANGAALIGVDRRAHSTKSPERLAEELQAILDGGCSRVQVCATAVVLKDPETAAVFRRFFGRPLNGKPAP